MLIVIDKAGQLCNRLWSYAPFIAYALHYKLDITILFFSRYAPLFERLDRFTNVRFLRISEALESPAYIAYAFVRRLSWLARSARIYLHSPAPDEHNLPNAHRRYGLTLVKSWTAPVSYHYLQEQHERLVTLFQPARRYRDKVHHTFGTALPGAELTLGVHLRRGDYRTYRQGRYYYTDEQYVAYLQQVAALFPSRRLRFFLCSNEPILHAHFAPLATFSLPQAEGIEDLYALSQCDYLLGPLSTYSMWASFYGRVPIHFIPPDFTPPSLANFRVIVAQNAYADGTRVVVQEST